MRRRSSPPRRAWPIAALAPNIDIAASVALERIGTGPLPSATLPFVLPSEVEATVDIDDRNVVDVQVESGRLVLSGRPLLAGNGLATKTITVPVDPPAPHADAAVGLTSADRGPPIYARSLGALYWREADRVARARKGPALRKELRAMTLTLQRLARARWACFFAAVLGCAGASAEGLSLVGRWYGATSPQSGITCWINQRRADGTYQIEFRRGADGAMHHREEGIWFHANGLYVTVTQRINGEPTDLRDRRLRDVYRVIEITDRRFTYADVTSGAEFSVERVSETFAIGNGCPPVSGPRLR